MTEDDLFALLGQFRGWAVRAYPYVLDTFWGQMSMLTALILVLTFLSGAIPSWWRYRRHTRYRGSLICTAKQERYWGVETGEGFFTRATSRPSKSLNEPYVLETKLDDGRYALLVVSPFLYRRARIGGNLPRRIARKILRRARFVVRPPQTSACRP